MCKWFRRFLKNDRKRVYSLIDTFGCTEIPPQNCPTFLEREVHQQFKNALNSVNIIVVYGESRQGKTWTIERYCPEQMRIGCNAEMSVTDIKIEMLHLVNTNVLQIEHTVTDEYSEGERLSIENEGDISASAVGISAQLKNTAGIDSTNSRAHKETIKTNYPTVDLSNSGEFYQILQERASGKYYVFDNFHYLQPETQKNFCSLLKEFNYRGIKIIIVGVWKDASRITSLAPDLLNRCAHIDIGSWNKKELDKVIELGERALNITLGDYPKTLFTKCCVNNIGILKDFIQKYCQEFDVYETQQTKRLLDDEIVASKVAQQVIEEAFKPLHDRAINLALPQRVKKDSKHMRQKIVISILQLIVDSNIDDTQEGISIADISAEMAQLSENINDEHINISNLTQELGLIHEREENRQAGNNFIPLFFFDKANKRLLVLEPTIYEIKAYNPALLVNIIDDIKKDLIVPSYDQMNLIVE